MKIKILQERQASTARDFVFNKEEINTLNQSIAKIVGSAMKVLGASGEIPKINPTSLQKVDLDPSQKDPTPIKKLSEEDDEEDIESLRQKYYGPGGELEKYGPKTVKNAPKGLGKMTASDFEEAGYVMKVPMSVLDDFQNLVESIKKTDVLYTQARDWYHNIRELLEQETNNDRDAALLGLLIATYSPRAKFALNLAEAVFMYKAVQMDASNNPDRLKHYLETFPGSENKNPGEPRGFTGAHKVPNFALNLIAPKLSGERNPETGEMKYNDFYMWNSTIDTWMIDAFYPSLKKASTSKEWEAIKGKLMSTVVSYRYMAQLVANEAKKLKLLPHELQAIIWVSMQIRQTGDPSLGVTTQFAFNQIREAISNIRQINANLEEVNREMSDKSWLGILIDEIDTKGFEEAGKFIHGIRDEKGKAVAAGIRSVVSRGKKGSAYKYYPEPEKEKPAKGSKEPKKAVPKAVPDKEPEQAAYKDESYSDLSVWYVMNNIIQMPTGKFNNLYDSITLYLDPEFSTEKAVEYITGRFDPEASASKDYFKESLSKRVIIKIKGKLSGKR